MACSKGFTRLLRTTRINLTEEGLNCPIKQRKLEDIPNFAKISMRFISFVNKEKLSNLKSDKS